MQLVYWNKTRIYNISRVGNNSSTYHDPLYDCRQGGGGNHMCKQCIFVTASTDNIAIFKVKVTAFFGDVIPRSLVEIYRLVREESDTSIEVYLYVFIYQVTD